MFQSRKLIAFFLALVLLLSLAACANGNDGKKPGGDNTSDHGNTPGGGNNSDDGNIPEGDDTPGNDDTSDNGNDADDDNIAKQEVDLTKFFETLGETYEMAATGDMDETLTESYLPGLNEITLRQSVLKTAMITSAVCEILLVECENSDDVATVEEIFNARVKTQVDGGAWYPASIEMWEDAQVVTAGNYVALFADSHAASMADDFRALFDK